MSFEKDTTVSLGSRAASRSRVGRAPHSLVRGPEFNTRSGYILSFPPPLIQKGQLPITGESMCTKYWSTAKRSKSR